MSEILSKNNELPTPKPVTEVTAFNPDREKIQNNGLMEMNEAVFDGLTFINEQIAGKTPEEIRVLLEEGEQEILASFDKISVSNELKRDFTIYVKQIFQEIYTVSENGNVTQEEFESIKMYITNNPFDYLKHREEINSLLVAESKPQSVPKEPFQIFTTPDDGSTPKPVNKGEE